MTLIFTFLKCRKSQQCLYENTLGKSGVQIMSWTSTRENSFCTTLAAKVEALPPPKTNSVWIIFHYCNRLLASRTKATLKTKLMLLYPYAMRPVIFSVLHNLQMLSTHSSLTAKLVATMYFSFEYAWSFWLKQREDMIVCDFFLGEHSDGKIIPLTSSCRKLTLFLMCFYAIKNSGASPEVSGSSSAGT